MSARFCIAMLHQDINDPAKAIGCSVFVFVVPDKIATLVEPRAKAGHKGSDNRFGRIADALEQHRVPLRTRWAAQFEAELFAERGVD